MSKHPVIIKNLVDFGLSEKEAEVYVALLENEAATAQQVASSTKINRSSVYVTLDSLIKIGLVSISNDKNVQRYVATSPDMLIRSVDSKISRQQEVKKGLAQIVPELKGLYGNTAIKPLVKVFEGSEGLIAAFEDTLNSQEKITRVSSRVENLYGIIPNDYFPSYIKKRALKGIRVKGIHPNTNFSKKITGLAPEIHKESVLIPEKKFKFPADFAIYDNKIGYMSSKNGGVAILIEDTEIAEVMKSIFDMAWKEAKRLSKKKIRQ